jgi:hypothetical protein
VGPPDGTPTGPEPRAEPDPDARDLPGDDDERFLAERPPHHDREH